MTGSRNKALPATRLRTADLLTEAWRSIARTPWRSMLTAVGTLLSAAAFVATLGISGTINQQVSATFDLRRATTVTVEAGNGQRAGVETDSFLPEWAEPQRLDHARMLSGVTAAGVRLGIDGHTIARGPNTFDTAEPVPLIALDDGALAAMDPRVVLGRSFDAGHQQRGDHVIMLAAGTAERLRVARTGVAVYVGGRAYTVTGIYDDVARGPDALAAALVPLSLAPELAVEGAQRPQAVVATLPGAAAQVGAQIALALQPNAPETLAVVAPPDPKTLRQEVEGGVTQLSLLVSVIALVVGAVSIGNAAMAGIAQRTGEIGLRQALGARRRDIFAQLLGETTALGLLGGAAGAGVGILVTVAVSLSNRWQPILDLRLAVAAVAAGALAGALAGFWPALTATRIPPAQALNR